MRARHAVLLLPSSSFNSDTNFRLGYGHTGFVSSLVYSEGIQKFLFPDALGVGRFLKIGRSK